MPEWLPFGWLANAVLIAGAYTMSPMRRWPFLLTVIGEGIWTFEAYRSQRTDMAFICIVFGLLAGRNFWKWSRQS